MWVCGLCGERTATVQGEWFVDGRMVKADGESWAKECVKLARLSGDQVAAFQMAVGSTDDPSLTTLSASEVVPAAIKFREWL
jgi:hypothetical protein